MRGAARAQTAAPYLDPKLPVEQRIADLLSRMTVEEKVAQMTGAWENRGFFSDPQALFVDEKGNFLPERAAVLLKYGIGEISRPSEGRDPRAMVEYTNTVQKWVKQNTPAGDSGFVSRRVSARARCAEGHVLSAGDCAGVDLGYRAGNGNFYGDGGGGAGAGRAALPGSGAGPGARSALGADGGNVRGGSLPGFAHRAGGDYGFSGERRVDRQGARDGHRETLRGARATGGGYQRGAGKLFGAGGAGVLSKAV